MTDEIIGMIISMVGMVITVISFQIKNKAPLLLTQSIGSFFFLVSYIFSGGGIAIYVNIIFLVRNTLFMFIDCSRGSLKYIVCAALCASYIATYTLYVILVPATLVENLWLLLPVLAALFGTVGTSFENVNVYRMWKYGDSLSWLAFNSHIGFGALGGIIGEVINLASITVGIIRYRKK
ncbi:MAG: YgjV family protein [Clostridia bacterium]|nr:YgjV family protein [Clostridia bacterium]